MNSKRWSNTTKIIVLALLSVLGVVLLITFRAMIRPTIIAFLVTFILSRPVNWVQRRTGWSRAASIVGLYVVVLALLALAPVIFIPRLVDSFESLMAVLEALVQDLQTAAPGPIFSLGNYQLGLESLFQQIGTLLQTIVSPAAAGALGFALSLTVGVFTLLYVMVLSFWLLKDMSKLQRTVLLALPTDYREEMRLLGQELSDIWNAFLRGQFVLGLVVGIATWVVMTIVGLPNAAGLALLAGVMEFLPTVGPGISGAIGTAVALFQGSTWLPIGDLPFALIVLALYVFITQIESIYLIPRLVGRRVHLHPAVTFVGIVNAAVVFGVLGVLLVTPTIASTRSILTYIYHKLRDQEPFKQSYIQTGVRIRGLIAGHRIEAVVFDLDGTLTQLDCQFADQMATRLHRLDRFWSHEQRKQFVHRLMVFGEGPISRWIGLLSWLQLHDDVQRMMPILNRLRALPPAENLVPHPGVPALLQNLSHQYQLGLITIRTREQVDAFLAHSDLPAQLFDAIIARDDVRNLAPHSEALTRSLEILHVQPDQAMIVSDTELNLRAAQAMGVVRCGVLCGLGEKQDFSDADLILAHTVDLKEWL